jgi:hypothetical protein
MLLLISNNLSDFDRARLHRFAFSFLRPRRAEVNRRRFRPADTSLPHMGSKTGCPEQTECVTRVQISYLTAFASLKTLGITRF